MANVIEFQIKGFDQASGAFKNVNKSSTDMAKSIAKSTAQMSKRMVIASAAAATSIFLLTKRIAGLQDRVGKLSLRLGIAVERLSEFHFAAELGGLSTQTFDMALQRMTRRISEAADGTGEARQALVDLGLNARNLAQIPLDQQMNQVSDALNNVTTQGEKVRLAFKLFDSEGVSVLQTMEKGSQSFRDAAQDLARFGAVVTQQGAANAEAFNNSVTRMGAAFDGLSMTMGTTFIPIFTGVINMFADFIANNRVRFAQFIKNLVIGFIQFGIIAGQVVTQVRKFFGELFSVEGFADTLMGMLDAFAQFAKSMVSTVLKIAPLMAQAMIIPFKAGWEAFKELGKGAWNNLMDFIKGTDTARSFSEIVHDAVTAAAQEISGLVPIFDEYTDIIIGNAKATGDALTSIFGINTELAREQAEQLLEGLMEFGQIVEEQQSQHVERAQTFIDFMRTEMDSFMSEQRGFVEQFAKEMFTLMINTTNAVGQAFAQVIVDGKSASEVFKNLAKEVLKQIIATYIAMKLQRLIAMKLTPPEAGANMMSTMSAAPFPINLTAPALAAKHAAIATKYVAAGAAHGGLDYVPQEQTFLLSRGERVLSPSQNRDLTGFLDAAGQGAGGANIGEVTVIINTAASRFEDITDEELEDFVGGRLIRTLDRLDEQGVRQNAIERSGV